MESSINSLTGSHKKSYLKENFNTKMRNENPKSVILNEEENFDQSMKK